MYRKLIVFRLLMAVLAGLPFALLSADSLSPADLDFFEKKVRPILVERCYECHSAEGGKTKGNLAVDSKNALLQGGDNGPALVAGNADKSLIIEAIRYKNRDMQMPPKSALPAAELKILETWVERGAPDPRTQVTAHGPQKIDLEKGRQHWAFRPVAKVSPPDNGHPIDAFIQAKLSENKLTLSPPADPVTLIRRMSFDLTGLPPSPEEAAAFEAEYSRQPQTAVRTLIDRLLASPHYGEKWGRHWLDVARYADSNGLDENIALGTAWRYRDYVVRSFNADKPFDQFLTEQIAGDLLPAKNLAERHEHATATAFLNLGAKVLAEADKEKLTMDVVDEQIETTGRAFLGMTLGCVRCHDHKFDPISHEDYYALAAIFKSTRSFSDERTGAISYWHETPVGGLDDFAIVKSAELALTAKKKELATAKAAAKKMPADEAKKMVEALMTEAENVEKNLPDLPTVIGVMDATEIQSSVPIHIRGSHLTLGKPVERGFPKVMQASLKTAPAFPKEKSGRLELARWLASPEHPLTARVIANRVWTWHFSQGIARTPDNFGLLGDAPTHPELLDWLATWLPENGWSLKDLHRLILTSATYQQASAPSLEQDPENRLWHHFPVRRLQAEEIRDALLSVAGKLDLSMGGKTVPLRNRQFVFNHTSKDATKYDSTRRALYLPVIRNNLYDLFQQFDYPDPTVSTGLRNSTVVSPQALLLMNSPVAEESARGFAHRIMQQGDDFETRIAAAIRLAYAREAKASDRDQAQDFLVAADGILASTINDHQQREQRTWELLCQSLMMANEFIYLR
ncbi:PSD1 and planctomycete cytochrome C domain-containing protein [Prosthecobacter sp. SYSU 5D2]|uniref:PSD1 and planctomycete cytochrome C domain-containing protein n=1 Tax=Prosthecobacter sp. SYSU 5D2 TaxID=3134134 RepID=UPI0031FF20FA